jgi:polar amino acid transport system substrate-binding protein
MQFLLIVLAGLILAACSPKEKPTLKIGMNMNFPPFGSEVDGAYVGVDVDLAHKIAEKLEQPYEIIDLDFDNLIPAILSGKIDIAISAMSITEERSRQIEFTQGYYTVNQAVITKTDSPVKINSINEIANYNVGVTSGTTALKWVEEKLLMKDLITIDQLLIYPDMDEALQDLMKGQIDIVINDEVAIQGYEDKYPITNKFLIENGESYGIAMHAEGPYNQKIKAALQDLLDSGEMKSIIQTHIQ